MLWYIQHSPTSSSQTQLVPWECCHSSFLSVQTQQMVLLSKQTLQDGWPCSRVSWRWWIKRWDDKVCYSVYFSVCLRVDSPWASVCQWPYRCTSSCRTCPWWRSLQTGLSPGAGSTQVRTPRRDVWLWRFPSPEHTGDTNTTRHLTLLSSLTKEIYTYMGGRPAYETVWSLIVDLEENKDADNRKKITLGRIMLTVSHIRPRQDELHTDEKVSTSSSVCELHKFITENPRQTQLHNH